MNTGDDEPSAVVELTVSGGSADKHLRALHTWLSMEDEFRGRLQLRHHPIAEGDMGGGLDVLAVVLGSGGAGAVLVQSVSTWLSQRRSDVTVTVKSPDGSETTVTINGTKDPLAVINEVQHLVFRPPHG